MLRSLPSRTHRPTRLGGWVALASMLCLPAALVRGQAPPVPMGKANTLSYVRQVGDKLVPETDITHIKTANGTRFESRTYRPGARDTFKVEYDNNGKLKNISDCAEEKSGRRQLLLADVQDGGIRVQRPGGLMEFFSFDNNPIITSSPDWGDIVQLVHRYDQAKGGTQTFPGLFIHPSRSPERVKLSIDRVGEDTISTKAGMLKLDRFRVNARSGDYLTWADADKKVYRMMPVGKPNDAVMLDGFYDETRNLGQ